ncbi:hypothetical protein SAMN02910357_02080 [Succinivibrio dextrinosolvens]|uniref:hypothetical protein n=1 Tax=Succinivibrio dextrinosolvens TaxID=83771 RepID=UPI0008ECCE44|nr:hypothetical protein [Succinivibrio dextrinosolvens]SFS83023.1 hypothetical protein SAMN02910357_02080 [Succinivibrio dextrinosolvens]
MITTNKDESFISVVTVINRLTANSLSRLAEIQNELDTNFSDYEIILVVQKSLQNVLSNRIEQILKEIPCVRYLQLSSDVNSDVIWSAGTENAIGDFIICFDLCNDPVSLIKDSVELCRQGNDVVVGTTRQNHSFAYQIIRPLSGWLLKLIDYHLPKDATTFRCLSRRALNSVLDTGKFYHQFFMQIQKSGYGQAELHYTALNTDKRTLTGAVKSTLRLMVFNSTSPLRIMSLLGLTGSTLACLFSLYSIILNLFKNDVVEGWTSTVFIISLLASMQFVILSFIAEYLNRILAEQTNANGYSIVFEKNSQVMINLDRINVLEQSTSQTDNLVQTGRDR